jgi:molecular chaperone HtpG
MYQTSVDLGGLLTVVSENLYSTPMVCVRELVQNAHDSITRRQFEDHDFNLPAARIDVRAEQGTVNVLRITDTGAGLTEEEIHAFLATVGSGYTRKLREQIETGDGSDLIGLFGIGFLSAFVVADNVAVITTSFKNPHLTLRYASADGHSYTVEPYAPHPVGSTVELTLTTRHEALADERRIAGALTKYATLLKYPIYVGGSSGERSESEGSTENRFGGSSSEPAINAEPAPWRDGREFPPAERKRRELDFASRFEYTFEPITTIAVSPAATPDEPLADARGLLWIQDGGTYGTSDNRNLSVFVRRMLLDDDARDLLPRWAGFIGGAIESIKLTPTASREDLQRDDAYEAVKQQLTTAIIDGLERLVKQEPDTWRRILRRHNTNLVGAALAEPRLFDLLADDVKVSTTEGDMTVAQLASRSPERRFHVTLGSGSGFEDMLLRAQRIPVARGEFFGVLALLRRYADRHGNELIELGSDEANRQLFVETTLDPLDRAFLAEHLADDDERLIPARFTPISVPLVVVPDREAELKKLIEDDDADNRISASALRLARMYTNTIEEKPLVRLFVNTDNGAIQELLAARKRHDPRAQTALVLLRSVKALLTTAAEGKSTDLSEALNGISETIHVLLNQTPGTDS